MIFIQAIPDNIYFQWQIEVQITNFRKFDISKDMEICIWYRDDKNFDNWKVIMDKYPEVKFFFYKDQGVNLGLYIPQLRPHILKMHFKEHEERLKDKVFFYHDSDIIFNFLPNFKDLENDEICWQSDTSSYLDSRYIRGKEKQGNIPEELAIKTFAKIGGITTDIIDSYQSNTGGAQVILKNIDYTFWEDVEKMCIDIRNSFFFGVKGSINNKYFKSENDGFQSWCADMWALNFSLWKRNIKTSITKELDFSWATSSKEQFLLCPIFHNAGVASPGDLFYKGSWTNSSPIGISHKVKEDSASFFYVKAIEEVK